jgi:hypothetical protein
MKNDMLLNNVYNIPNQFLITDTIQMHGTILKVDYQKLSNVYPYCFFTENELREMFNENSNLLYMQK